MIKSVNIYAHNHATSRYGKRTWAEHTPTVMATCPVCLASVAYHDNRLKHHIENCGFTICEAGGYSLSAAQAMAATMTIDFRLAQEGGFD